MSYQIDRKKTVCVYIMVIAVFAAVIGCDRRIIQVPEVTGEEFMQISSGETKHGILVLDVRLESEYLEGHVKNAVSIPTAELAARVDEIRDYLDKPIYVYSESYELNIEALEILVQHDFTRIFSVEGILQFKYPIDHHISITARKFLALREEPSAVVIDYRLSTAYNTGHIRDALHIEYGSIHRGSTQLPKDRMLLLYSNMGTAAAEGAEELAQAGYTLVYACIEGASEYPFELVIKDEEKK